MEHNTRTLIAAALVMIAGLAVPDMSAGRDLHAQECTDSTGDERDCTGTEEFWQCIADAHDAYAQCKDSADGFGDRVICFIAWDLDKAACWSDLFDAISPFH